MMGNPEGQIRGGGNVPVKAAHGTADSACHETRVRLPRRSATRRRDPPLRTREAIHQHLTPVTLPDHAVSVRMAPTGCTEWRWVETEQPIAMRSERFRSTSCIQ